MTGDLLAGGQVRRVLDVFCCQGGASTGYARAGFAVYGVDLFEHKDGKGRQVGHSRARYPFPSYKGDAIQALRWLVSGLALPFEKDGEVEWLTLADFDAVAGSPPCQAYSVTRHTHSNEHPELIDDTRNLFEMTGLPWIIENVPGAPLLSALTLCGTEFGLVADDHDGRRLYLRRHRLFEANFFLLAAGGCRCLEFRRKGWDCGGVYGGGSTDYRHARDTRRGGYTPGLEVQKQLLGIDWMTRRGMDQSIPPAYTEFLGWQLLAQVERNEVAA